MRTVTTEEIISTLKDLCISAAYDLGSDVEKALNGALASEVSPLGQDVLGQIKENVTIARDESRPMCQDTGIAVVFVDVGRDVHIDGPLDEAVNEGVRQGYEEGYLRKSVCSPLERKNTGDNTPAIIHTRIVEGDKLTIQLAPKGAGSENMSRIAMLKPAQGIPGIKDFIVESVSIAGGNPCPPTILGIGIGGNFEVSAMLSKRALLREIGSVNEDSELAALEAEILEAVNNLGIGPMGFGGTSTAYAVHVEAAPCHIASLPVALNIQCHAARHKEAVI